MAHIRSGAARLERHVLRPDQAWRQFALGPGGAADGEFGIAAGLDPPCGFHRHIDGVRRHLVEHAGAPLKQTCIEIVGDDPHASRQQDKADFICRAPGTEGKLPPRLIGSQNMPLETRGTGSNVRHVCNILPETEPADSLLVVEVITPAGNWSSYPPHKHDTDNLPEESYLEETYYHRVNPPQGFILHWVYDDSRELDETMAAEDRTVVLVPRGYHPVGAPHGYESYYLNVMAGPKRIWKFKNDPAHEWMLS